MSNNIVYFNKESECLENSCLLGNGNQGAIVYGGTKVDHIGFNNDTFWSGYGEDKVNYEGKKYIKEIADLLQKDKFKKAHILLQKYVYGGESEAYQPLCDLDITYDYDDITNYKRQLDMENGLASLSFNCNKGKVSREYFANNPTNIICSKVNFENKVNFTVKFSSIQPYTFSNQEGMLILDGYAPYICNNVTKPKYDKDKKSVRFKSIIKINTDGKMTIKDNEIIVEGASYYELYFKSKTSLQGKFTNKSLINEMHKLLSYDELLNNHKADFSKLYNKISLNINDDNSDTDTITDVAKLQKDDNAAAVIKMFNFGRYLMISTSRKGCMPPNLQGVWNEYLKAPWSSNYTTNINLQMNYWGIHQVGLGDDCFEPLLSFIKRLYKSGQITAKEVFDSNGWCCHHNSDIWNLTSPIGHKGCPPNNSYSLFMGGGGWFCLHLFEHYKFTNDNKYLKEIMPILKGAIDFYNDNLYECEKGMTLMPSLSPENRFKKHWYSKRYACCTGCTMDMSILKQLIIDYIAGLKVFGKDAEVKNYKKLLNSLKPIEITSDGRIMEWNEEYNEVDISHRHISHLYGNHPGNLVKVTDKKLQDAVKKSLNVRGDKSTGWSIAWKLNQWARLFDGERCYKIIRLMLNSCLLKDEYGKEGRIYTNYLCAHPPFQVDGNFGFMSGVVEMIVQCRENKVFLLPAIPSKWKNGEVKGFKLFGAMTMNMVWKDGKITKLLIESDEDKVIKVVFKGKIKEIKTNKEISL